MSENPNKALHDAKRDKNDEYYTQLTDIEKELKHYKRYFRGKVVYCNCDDPRVSNFFHYFSYNFEHLELKRLITTCYRSRDRDSFSRYNSNQAIWLDYNGDKNGNTVPDIKEIDVHPLKENGDFRSEECVKMLEEADIVVTNPPFSLFREYVKQIIEHKKKFIILGNKNAITYKEIYHLIKEGQLWVGYTPMGADMLFEVSPNLACHLVETKKEGSGYKIVDDKVMARSQSAWFTNLEHKKRNEGLILTKKYSPKAYPQYDNFDAIEVSKTKEIPRDYNGLMGVPISFLDKYNPEQFELVRFRKGDDNKDLTINGKTPFFRIIIRNRGLS